MNELPISWQLIDIAAVTDVIGGGTPSTTISEYYTNDHEKGIAWITPADLSGYTDKYIAHGRRSITKKGYNASSARIMPKGTVLFSSRAPIGYTVIAANDISTNQGFKSFVPNEGVDSKYLYYYLKSIKYLAESVATGTTFKELSGKMAKTLPFPLAPLAEQKRIVEKLDEVLAQVDAIKTRLDNVPEILKRFRQSVLAAAVSGKILHKNGNFQTNKVGDPWAHTVEAPSHWKIYEFKQAVKITGGSQPPKSEFTDEDSEGTIRLIQIRDYKSDLYKVFIPLEKARRFCSKTDIMIGRYGPPIFQILRGLEGAYNVALMKAEPVFNELNKEYLYIFLQNTNLFNYINAGSARTAGQAGVNKKYLEMYPFFIPPIHEQKEIVRLVDQYFAFADTIEKQVAKAQVQVNNLTQSILKKAFSGKLVAQNPNDEPAEQLLAKIAKARKEAEAIEKAAKKIKK